MTKQKSFKRRVRARMEKTGESYTAARRILIAGGDRPDGPVVDGSSPAGAPTPRFEPPVSEERLVEATGRTWAEWFSLMDDAGALTWTHTEMARWLREQRDVGGWWSQSIAVGYERARGLRAPGQRADGWSVTATKTIAVPVERAFESWQDERVRRRWLPEDGLSLRTATAPKSARYDWEDGTTRVIVSFEAVGDMKTRVAMAHERLPDAETAEQMKLWWRQRLVALKEVLEAD